VKRHVLAAFFFLACAFVAAGAAPRAQGQTAPLRVATMPLEPFVIADGDRLTGFSVDLWGAIAEQLGVQYQWVQVGSVEELLAAVRTGQADVGIAGISMTPDREKAVDFTLPFFNAGLRIMTSTRSSPTVRNLVGILFSPTLLKVLGFSFVVLLVIAHIIWLVERGSNEAIPKAYLPGIWEALWWALAILSTHEYGAFAHTRARSKRLLAMLTVAISVILIAQFTASVTASLTVHQLNGYIRGAADLPGKRIATVRGTTGAEYLADQHLRSTEVESIADAYFLLAAGHADAIVFDAPVLLYYASTAGRGKTQVVGPTLKDEYYGIALPAGSALRKPINEALLEMMQDGAYRAIHDRWFGTG
jgi:polar amino acid transport system substrate-binding protein